MWGKKKITTEVPTAADKMRKVKEEAFLNQVRYIELTFFPQLLKEIEERAELGYSKYLKTVSRSEINDDAIIHLRYLLRKEGFTVYESPYERALQISWE